ncbi:RNI-like protein [Phlegmacium glaucopus]|nr:RNI-like protein [Phlegmacium glaucopus]
MASVGARINLHNHLGTIKYAGPVNNTTGIWLGVEWDDPERGKHDGSKDGKQYFTCQLKNAGSFIRPTSHLVYGVSFLTALVSKYVEELHGSDTQEKVVLGSSQGAIEVEAVSLDKIRQRFSRLDQLREVSLEYMNVSKGDEPGRILESCPNVRGLDLSSNLLPSWEIIAEITRELPLLRRLSLNRNRLQLPSNIQSMEGAFQSLTDLQLNATFLSWTEIQTITSTMPKLQLIEMGYNQLSCLSGVIRSYDCNVQVINLDTNNCSDWVHLCTSFSEYRSLQRIVLTSNRIGTIPFPNRPEDSVLSIKYLSLSNNLLSAWSDIDALSCWIPTLETLTMGGNPLTIDTELGKHSRPFIIARIPSLLTLDGAAISPKERTDSELFYMSTIMQQGPTSDDAKRKSHYHWLDLCNKHGTPREVVNQHKSHDKLGNRLIELMLYQANDQAQGTVETSLRVLPTMSLRNLRLKICKTLRYDARNTSIDCWLRMPNGSLTTLGHENDTRDLDWLGIETGSQIIYQKVQ